MENRNLKVFVFVIAAIYILTTSAFAQERTAMTVNGAAAIISGSSFCNDYEDIKFSPEQAFNGKPDRPWMADGSFDPKKPDWIQITFTKPVGLSAMRISPGFGNTNKYFYSYSRLKKIKVVLEKSAKGGVTAEARTYYRRFDGDPRKDMLLLFPSQPTVKSVRIAVLEVYPGKKSKAALIGNIEPVIVVNGKTFCSSSAVSDVLSFLRSTASANSAFNFIPAGKTIQIKKTIKNTNPLDPPSTIKRSYNLNRDQLRKQWDIWASLCSQLYYDYRFNSHEAVNYFWTDAKSGLTFFDMTGSEFSDVVNSYMFTMSRMKVTETVTKKDEKTKKETKVKITVMKSVINKIVSVSDVYAP